MTITRPAALLEIPVLSLKTERRASNVKRNAELISSLGMQHGFAPKPKRRRKVDLMQPQQNTSGEPTGMAKLLQTATMSTSPLNIRYPHRQAQIRKLFSFLSVPVAACSLETVYRPPPIFVTGPCGTGKTSIIQNVIRQLEIQNSNDIAATTSTQSSRSMVLHSYTDCNTLDAQNIEELVGNAYDQFEIQAKMKIGNLYKREKRFRSLLPENHRLRDPR
jgi:hypothetical protein